MTVREWFLIGCVFFFGFAAGKIHEIMKWPPFDKKGQS